MRKPRETDNILVAKWPWGQASTHPSWRGGCAAVPGTGFLEETSASDATDRPIDSTGRRGRQTGRQTRQTDRPTDRQTRQTERQTDRQTRRSSGMQTHQTKQTWNCRMGMTYPRQALAFIQHKKRYRLVQAERPKIYQDSGVDALLSRD